MVQQPSLNFQTTHLLDDPDALLWPAVVVLQDKPRLVLLLLLLRPQSRRQRLAEAAT